MVGFSTPRRSYALTNVRRGNKVLKAFVLKDKVGLWEQVPQPTEAVAGTVV